MTDRIETAPAKAPKGLATKHIVLILGSLVIICGAVVAVILLRPGESATAGTPVIDESNLNDIVREMEEKVAKGMFETHMNTTWTFPDGKSPSSDAIMGNAPSNNYPFWFEVAAGAAGVVYTSSLLPVGSQIAEIVLDQNLDPGTYPAVLTLHMVEEDGAEVESNMGFNITLVVEN